jgi:pimeloyl-ACP methyl ester carboxylesterase
MPNAYMLPTEAAPIHVADTGGGGIPLLMLHGTASAGIAFRKQFDSELAAQYRLVTLDLPGHGQSGDAAEPARDYTLTGFTRTVEAVIDQLGLRGVVVYGWSLGGHIGIELLQHPAVAGLMFTGAPPVGKGPIDKFLAVRPSRDMFLAAKERFNERDVRRFDELCFPQGSDAALVEAMRRSDGRARGILVRSILRGDGSNQRRAVVESQVPVAMVSGSDEPFVRLGYLDAFRFPTLWKGAAQVIEGAGHAPFWDRATVFNRVLTQFADEVAATEMAEPERMARSA